ncbi:MAG: metallopeptidase TldD-related protein, partial [Candidatus Heimdallarchaeaceae archaeon]
PNTTAIDDEGVPQSRTEIIKHGNFVHALNDSQHLDFGSEEHTGNAFRVKHYELFPRSYQAYPEIYPSNLIISPGSEQIGEMMDDISEGIFLNRIQGQMTADYNTGQFKVSSIDAYLIENGSIRGSLASIAVIGNIFDILSAFPRFSRDRQSVRPTLTPYSILSPYVMTEVVSVFP